MYIIPRKCAGPAVGDFRKRADHRMMGAEVARTSL